MSMRTSQAHVIEAKCPVDGRQRVIDTIGPFNVSRSSRPLSLPEGSHAIYVLSSRFNSSPSIRDSGTVDQAGPSRRGLEVRCHRSGSWILQFVPTYLLLITLTIGGVARPDNFFLDPCSELKCKITTRWLNFMSEQEAPTIFSGVTPFDRC